jgi:phospholipid/cholesterol/gamma-HCH transport system substrate-binding protein
MKLVKRDLISGIFVFFFLAFLASYSVKLGEVELFGQKHYRVCALFDSASGLKNRAQVEIAGVPVGMVNGITLDRKTNEARVCLEIDGRFRLQDDVIVSIRTEGLIGGKYISLSPGASSRLIQPGDTLLDTESAVDFERLIDQLIK